MVYEVSLQTADGRYLLRKYDTNSVTHAKILARQEMTTANVQATVISVRPAHLPLSDITQGRIR